MEKDYRTILYIANAEDKEPLCLPLSAAYGAATALRDKGDIKTVKYFKSKKIGQEIGFLLVIEANKKAETDLKGFMPKRYGIEKIVLS